MQRHHEVRLSSPTLQAREILRACLRFATQTQDWEPHPNGLEEHDKLIGLYCLVIHTGKPASALALVADHKNSRAVTITNIVPQNVHHLMVTQYNQVAQRFVSDFRLFVQRQRLGVRIKLTVFKLSLQTAIPSPKCREFFERYLHGHPLSFHPSDVGRLDTFICALHRYRGRVDLEALCAYLVSQRQWKTEDAQTIGQRIQIGLEVLKINSRF